MPAFTKVLVRISAVLLIVGAAAQAQAQTKFGFVNAEKIISQLPEIKDIDQKLSALQTSYADTLRAIEQNYKAKLEAYQRQQAMMVPEAKAKEEEALRLMEQQYNQFRQERLGPQGTLAQYQAQLMQPVREKVRAAIEKVAKEEKLAAVMDEGAFIFVDTKLDITFKVLDYLKRGN